MMAVALLVTFLLPAEPIARLDAYLATEVGGAGIVAAHQLGPQGTIDVISTAGSRGRGGGGFPTGRNVGARLEAPSHRDVS